MSCNDPCVSTRWPLHPAVLPLLLFSAINVCSHWLLTHGWKTSANLLCWHTLTSKTPFWLCLVNLHSLHHLIDTTTIHVGQLHNYLTAQTDLFPPLHQTRKHHICYQSEKGEVTSSVTRLIGKTTAATHRVQYVPLGWGSGLLTRLFAPLTPDAAIISPSDGLKQKSDVQARWQIHSSEDNVSLWGATCHSLPRVGHTFLSLPWWISFPRPHVGLSGLKGRLWVSSSHHKVPFVPATMRSIHTCPHGDTWCQRMSQPWGRSWTNRHQWGQS